LDIGEGRLLAIANIHAHWNDKLAVVKSHQAAKTYQELVRIGSFMASTRDVGIIKSIANNTDSPTRVYYFFGGDFNTTGEIVNLSSLSGLENTYARYDMRENGVQLGEARGKPFYGAGNPATHLSPDYSHTIDHIFYNPNFVSSVSPIWSGCKEPCTVALRVLRIPRSDEGLLGEKYLPRYNEPSDHFPIGAEFVLY
jgi:hypothetical protein